MDETNEPRAKRARRSRAQIAELVAGYRPSGLTRRAYATAAGVPVATLTRWLRRSGPARAPGFAAVQLRPEPAAAGVVKIRWPEGLEVELPLSLGEAAVRRWLGEFVPPCSR